MKAGAGQAPVATEGYALLVVEVVDRVSVHWVNIVDSCCGGAIPPPPAASANLEAYDEGDDGDGHNGNKNNNPIAAFIDLKCALNCTLRRRWHSRGDNC